MGQSRLWVEWGSGSGLGAAQPSDGARAVPRTLAPACCPPNPPQGQAVCSAGMGGTVTAGTRGDTGLHQPYITCHLAWEPAPPTRSLGKARPALGEGAGPWCNCVCSHVCMRVREREKAQKRENCGHFLGRCWPPEQRPPHSEAGTPRTSAIWGSGPQALGACREGLHTWCR